MQEDVRAVFLETAHGAECIFYMRPKQTAYSSVIDSLVWLEPSHFYLLYSEAFSDLSVVFCNDIHSHNLENELFTLKVGYVIMCLNPSTTLPAAHVQVLMSDSSHQEIASLKYLFQNHTLSKLKVEENSKADISEYCKEKVRWV